MLLISFECAANLQKTKYICKIKSLTLTFYFIDKQEVTY